LTQVVLPLVGPVDYITDPFGRRIGKKLGGLLQRGWLWGAQGPIAELDATSRVTWRFVYADGGVPSLAIQGTNIYRILTDERGSVRLVVNVGDSSIAQELDYDEFARVLRDTAPGFQPFGYGGGLYDSDTGLLRFGQRDYAPETGQWTARDPILFDGTQYSLYAYVNNDPINLIDPLGTKPCRTRDPRKDRSKPHPEKEHPGPPDEEELLRDLEAALLKYEVAEYTEKVIGWTFGHAVEFTATSVEAIGLGSHVLGVTVDQASGGLTGAANRTVQANPAGLGRGILPQTSWVNDFIEFGKFLWNPPKL
jgi:RHS repeat-associated protein